MGWNLLILSDLHMGEQEPGESRARVQQRADILASHFGDFLEYYRDHREKNLPWRLVIAGDMIDFMRIHVPHQHTPTTSESVTELSPGTTPPLWYLPPHNLRGALQKLEQLFTLHQKTFYRLARFLLAGHELVILTGNHDAELDWPMVQEAFLQHLHHIAKREHPTLKPETLRSRIKFSPRFYYESNRIYIEHGHYYDGYCNIAVEGDPSAASRSGRGKELRLHSLSHVLNYTQFNSPKAFASLPIHHIDRWSATDILRWYAKRPLSQKLLLFYEFFTATLGLVMMAWSYSFRRLLQSPSSERKANLERWAAQHNLPVEAVEPLQQFVTPPVHTRFFDTIQALYVDRIFLISLTSFLLTVYLVSPWSPEWKATLATATVTLFVALFQYLSHRRPVCESVPMLFQAAMKIAAYLKTPLVVMAHSHHFEQRELHDGQLYINLGDWTIPHEMLGEEPDVHQPQHHPPRLPTTPPSSLHGVPEFETRYLKITTSHPPHQFTVGRWSYHRSTPFLCNPSPSSTDLPATPAAPLTDPLLATEES